MQAALVVIILLALLAGAVFVGHYGWVSAGDVVMPPWGWLMLCLGVFFNHSSRLRTYGLGVLQQPQRVRRAACCDAKEGASVS